MCGTLRGLALEGHRPDRPWDERRLPRRDERATGMVPEDRARNLQLEGAEARPTEIAILARYFDVLAHRSSRSTSTTPDKGGV